LITLYKSQSTFKTVKMGAGEKTVRYFELAPENYHLGVIVPLGITVLNKRLGDTDEVITYYEFARPPKQLYHKIIKPIYYLDANSKLLKYADYELPIVQHAARYMYIPSYYYLSEQNQIIPVGKKAGKYPDEFFDVKIVNYKGHIWENDNASIMGDLIPAKINNWAKTVEYLQEQSESNIDDDEDENIIVGVNPNYFSFILERNEAGNLLGTMCPNPDNLSYETTNRRGFFNRFRSAAVQKYAKSLGNKYDVDIVRELKNNGINTDYCKIYWRIVPSIYLH